MGPLKHSLSDPIRRNFDEILPVLAADVQRGPCPPPEVSEAQGDEVPLGVLWETTRPLEKRFDRL